MLRIEASRPNIYNQQQNAYRINRIQVANKAVPTFCAKEKAGKGFIKKALDFLSLKELKQLNQELEILRKNNKKTIKATSDSQDIALNI